MTGKTGTLLPQDPVSWWIAAIPVGIGATVSMWSAGYLCRLPFIEAPPWLLFFLLVMILILAGRVAASRSSDRFRSALMTGAIAGVIDLLVLGAVLVPEEATVSSVVVSASTFVLGCMALAALGAATTSGGGSTAEKGVESITRTAFFATLMLVGIGGLVTSEEAGMAVPDWPGSFGNNMFLLPLSRMTGGIYYEHAHRLFGSLVGLVTLSMAIYCWRIARRRSLSWLGLLASVQVVVQGILGGYRVTEAKSVEVVAGQVTESVESGLSLVLRVVHGIHGQLFLAVLAVMATLASISWRTEAPVVHHRTWARASRWLLVLLCCQLLLGGLSRHISRSWVVPHLIGGFLALLAVIVVAAMVGQESSSRTRSRLAIAMILATITQLSLGFMTLAATGSEVRSASSGVSETLLATLHQSLGAVILCISAALLCWCRRVPSADLDRDPNGALTGD